jgi:hypothetical protein
MNKSIRRGIGQSMTNLKTYVVQKWQAIKGFFVFIDEETDKMIRHASRVAFKFAVFIGGIVLLVIAFTMGSRVPTHIRADFTVNRFAFTVKNKVELKSILFESMDVRKFARIEMNPTQLAVKEADSTWRPLKLNELPLVITSVPGMLSYNVTVTAGKLEGFSINPGTKVILETPKNDPKRLMITMSNSQENPTQQPILLLYEKPFELKTEYGQVSSIELPRQDRMTFKATLPDLSNPHPHIEIHSQPNALVLSLTVLDDEEVTPFSIFSDDVILMTDLELFSMDKKRILHTTLVEKGEISYVEYPEKENIPFKDTDHIIIGEGSKLRIDKAIFDPQQSSIKLRVQGVVSSQARIRHVPVFPLEDPSFVFPEQNISLTFYDELMENRITKTVIENLDWMVLAFISIIGIILIEDFKKLVQNLANGKVKGEGDDSAGK